MVARRAGQPRRLKRLDPAAAGLLRDTLAAHVSPGVELPASLLQALTNGLAPPTWNRYLQTLLPWRLYAEARGLPALPADPVTFACFLAEAGAGSIGYSQTKARVCAIRALSDLAGLASPHAHPLVVGYRRGALRAGRGAPRRGRATPIFGHEIPVPLPADSPPGRPEPARARGRGTLSGRSRRARDATARHMAFLHDGALRYDDTLEGQLGNILLFPDVVDLSVFGTKTDRRLAGQPAALPRSEHPSSGCANLLQGVRVGLSRLASLDPHVLAVTGARLRAREARPVGLAAMSTWPDDIRLLAADLYAAGLPVHLLPIYGRWQFEDITADSDLATELPSSEFVRLSRAVLAEAGVDTAGVGAHSFRRARGVGLFHGNAGGAVVSQALRHRDPRSAEPYVLASARLTALARSMHVAAPAGSSSSLADRPRPAPAARSLQPLHGASAASPRGNSHATVGGEHRRLLGHHGLPGGDNHGVPAVLVAPMERARARIAGRGRSDPLRSTVRPHSF